MSNINIFDEMSKDVFNDAYFKKLFKKSSFIYANHLFHFLNGNDKLSKTEYIHLLRFADILSNSPNPEARNKSYQIISILNHNYKNDPIYRTYSKQDVPKITFHHTLKF